MLQKYLDSLLSFHKILTNQKNFLIEKRVKKNLNISTTNDVTRLKFQYVVHLFKSLEYGTFIFENCAVSEVTIEKYIGSL